MDEEIQKRTYSHNIHKIRSVSFVEMFRQPEKSEPYKYFRMMDSLNFMKALARQENVFPSHIELGFCRLTSLSIVCTLFLASHKRCFHIQRRQTIRASLMFLSFFCLTINIYNFIWVSVSGRRWSYIQYDTIWRKAQKCVCTMAFLQFSLIISFHFHYYYYHFTNVLFGSVEFS